jgi:peptidoglycan-N-acetylglucosamine deacetylase
MAVTSPPRLPSTSPDGRPDRPPHSPNGSGGQLRVRWDRVAILAAILILIVVLIAVLIVRAFSAVGRQGETAPVTDPAAATKAPVGINATAAEAMPTVAKASSVPSAELSSIPSTVAKPCPAPPVKPIYAAPPLSGGDQSMRTVALTFDDGPDKFTSQILDILREKQVRATFFVVGQMVAQRPNLLREIVDSGHLVGNHTWSHRTPPSSMGWKAATLTKEIARTGQEITKATGQVPCLFRPPGGVIKGAGKISRKAGLSMTIWSVDTRDWSGQSPGKPRFTDKVRKRARTGLSVDHPIVLMHDGGGYRGWTVAALPGIIDDYRAAGYQFVDMAGNAWPV